MEISKGLQEEILTVQNKLKNAIRDHQICVGKLKDDPNNTDILGQIQKIHLHIVSLGRCQKQVVQRLRKEVETFKAENVNGAKVSIASLLGLNNNNHITNNNETKLKTGGNEFSTKKSKEDYEDVVRNGDVPSPPRNTVPAKRRPSSVETISGEDDVIEVSMDENSNEKSEKEEPEKERKADSIQKINFLGALGLITTVSCAELQNKRAERKRRSTANPQFVYSSLEVPTKRKRHSYLQSGNVPQTRQTTARLNGPSPPPVKPVTQPPKSTSPPTSRTVMKSLIPVQKTSTRPNILRNATESKVFSHKAKIENGPSQIQLPVSTVKSVQSIGNKAVHIPGLPSSLTIERISNDSAVCISCRNPGTLTVCENCASNYHVSCHSISPAPSRICPKCALIEEEEIEDGEEGEQQEEGRRSFKKDEEFEEKERERYELRERNSDLRLQVYELEKRSQLLGQSLQLQQRTRQELLGKQEKTQRSIKRLVDFIKLMQLRKSGDSPPPSASVSFPPRPSSSQSLQTTPPHQPSTSRMSGRPQSTPSNEKVSCRTPPSSSISCLDRASPMSTEQSPKCPTPISYQLAASNQKSINHTSSSRKSQNQPEGQASLPKTKVTLQCSTISCQPHQATTLAFRPRSRSPTPPCSLVSSCPTPSIVTVRSKQIVQYPHSTASSTQKIFPSRPNINWNDRLSTAESPEPSQQESLVSISCDLPEPQKSYCLPTTVQNPINSYKSQSQASQRRQPCSVVVQSTGLEPVVFSTHCSQAITSPISSPIILESHETSAQVTKIPQSTGSNSCIKSTNWNQANEMSLRSNCSVVPSQNSSST